MRLVNYSTSNDATIRMGVLVGNNVHGDSTLASIHGEILAGNVRDTARRLMQAPRCILPTDKVTLHSPVDPPAFRDFMSFEQHLVNASGGKPVPPVFHEQPLFYFSNPASISAATEDVRISPASQAFDFELEIGAVVFRDLEDATPEEAADAILGYTVLCDWSARDIQRAEMAAYLGPVKGKDGATTVGPWLITPDELGDPAGGGYDLHLSAYVNGIEYGGGNWSDARWSFGQMIAYASRGTRVRAGDLIGSGTVPTGCILESVAAGGTRPWLSAGDAVRLDGGALGTIQVTILSALATVALEPREHELST